MSVPPDLRLPRLSKLRVKRVKERGCMADVPFRGRCTLFFERLKTIERLFRKEYLTKSSSESREVRKSTCLVR